MNKHFLQTVVAACAALTFTVAHAEEKVIAVTTSSGTISEFGGDRLIIRTETAPEPITYTYSKTTTYTDEAGNPVSIETVKSGLPVTVHYTKDGDKMVVSKVVVRKTVKSSGD
jgi:hypothetical protein